MQICQGKRNGRESNSSAKKKIRLFLNVQVDRLDGCCSTTTGRRGRQQKQKSTRLLGVLSPVSARADNGTKGGPSASQHLSAGSSSCISKGYILQEEMEKSKNFIIQSLFFSLFFFYTVASSFTFSMYFFFARTSGTKEDG